MILMALSSCGDNRPDYVLSDEAMESLLFDIYMTDGALNAKGEELNDSVVTEYYNSVFKAHGTTREQFEQSVTWYSSHLEAWEKVTENVAIELEKANGR